MIIFLSGFIAGILFFLMVYAIALIMINHEARIEAENDAFYEQKLKELN